MSAPTMATTGTRLRINVSRACARRRRNAHKAGASRFLRHAAYGSLFIVATLARAETWTFEPWITVEETLTNNVKLDPNGMRRADLVSQLAPGFRVAETGSHTKLIGVVSLPTLVYARTSENTRVNPQVNLLGNWEIFDRLFYVESSVNVNQQYLTPFGARSESLANATDNRYTSQTYRVSPYFKGSDRQYSYELRDNNIWTKGSSSVVVDSYTNDLVGTVSRAPQPLGWGIDIGRTNTKFKDQAPQLLELARGRALYEFDPQLQLSLAVGAEHNDLLLESKNDIIYGGGIHWQPTERANIEANWEHRFFGSSYNVSIENRRPLSLLRLVATRNINTYPQQLAALPGGVDVASVLDQLFLSRFPDPVARQNAVNQLIANRGLPTSLSSAVNLYTQQVTLQEWLTATAGILGARNSILFTAYRLRQEAISGSGNDVPDPLGIFTNNTQTGGNVVWTHGLTSIMTLTTSLEASRTVSLTDSNVTKQGAARAGITTVVAPFTSVYGGVRYQIQRSNATGDLNEMAVFVGVNHRFH